MSSCCNSISLRACFFSCAKQYIELLCAADVYKGGCAGYVKG